MIPLPPDELAIHDLVTLVANESVERFDNCAQVKSFRNGIDSILALRGSVVVVRTLEDEAQALWNEAHLRSLPPTQ